MPSSRATSLIAFAIAATLCATITAARAEAPTCTAPADTSGPNVLIKLLAPPPCDTCETTKAELAELNQFEAARTSEETKHATDDITISVPRFLDGANIKFDATLLEKCVGKDTFFDRLSKLTRATSDAAKNMFCRTRPYDMPGGTTHPLQQVKNSASYPSGHTTWGTAIGMVLAEMAPEKREEIVARIADYAKSRMIAGVHYKSDIDAGKILGAALAAHEFASDSEFKSGYSEAAECVRGALGLPGRGAEEAQAHHQ
jgi:acid phosphatase (class A)